MVSTSPSPENLPPLTETVALATVRLSGSDTVIEGDSVTLVLTANGTAVVWFDTVGGSSTAVMLMVVVATLLRLLVEETSSTTQVTVRLGFDVKSSGLSPDENFTESRTV